jgi:hypothetical protein
MQTSSDFILCKHDFFFLVAFSPSQWRRNAAGVGGGGLQPQTTASDPNSVTRWAVNGAIGERMNTES